MHGVRVHDEVKLGDVAEWRVGLIIRQVPEVEWDGWQRGERDVQTGGMALCGQTQDVTWLHRKLLGLW